MFNKSLSITSTYTNLHKKNGMSDIGIFMFIILLEYIIHDHIFQLKMHAITLMRIA